MPACQKPGDVHARIPRIPGALGVVLYPSGARCTLRHGGRGGGTANTDAPQVNEGVTGGLKAPRSSVVCGLCSREACVRALSSPFRTLTHLSVCPQRGT